MFCKEIETCVDQIVQVQRVCFVQNLLELQYQSNMYQKQRLNHHSPRSPLARRQLDRYCLPDVVKTIIKKSPEILMKTDISFKTYSDLKTSQTHSCRDSTADNAETSPEPAKSKLMTTSMTLPFKPKKDKLKNKIQQNKKILERIKNKIMKNQKTQEATLTKLKSQGSLFAPASSKLSIVQLEKCVNLAKSQSLADLLFKKKSPSSLQKEMHQQKSLNCLILKFNEKEEMFIILKYLDQGAYGKVYLVQHATTGFIICLKMIEKSQLNQESLKNLIQEIKVQSSLNHPNILNLYGCTADAENVYLLLEPCLGSNAYKKLTKEKVPEKDVRKYIKEICSAVDYLHKKDIIHRDIKAENILFHEDTAKLCDFGWAVHAPMLRNTQCGTPLYSPPEIIKNEYYDSKVDLWCIGVLTYEMLYGTSPFEIRHINDLAKIVEQEVFFSKGSISENGTNFIQRCLSKNPSHRLTIRQALEHSFLSEKTQRFRTTLS